MRLDKNKLCMQSKKKFKIKILLQDNSHMIFFFLSLMYRDSTVLLVHIMPIMSAHTVKGHDCRRFKITLYKKTQLLQLSGLQETGKIMSVKLCHCWSRCSCSTVTPRLSVNTAWHRIRGRVCCQTSFLICITLTRKISHAI